MMGRRNASPASTTAPHGMAYGPRQSDRCSARAACRSPCCAPAHSRLSSSAKCVLVHLAVDQEQFALQVGGVVRVGGCFQLPGSSPSELTSCPWSVDSSSSSSLRRYRAQHLRQADACLAPACIVSTIVVAAQAIDRRQTFNNHARHKGPNAETTHLQAHSDQEPEPVSHASTPDRHPRRR